MGVVHRALESLRRLGALLRRWARRRWQQAPSCEDGPIIPFVPGGAEVPQGLGYDSEHGEFVYTLYDGDDPTAGTIVFADADGRVSARVPLTGLDHYGGVTVVGARAYVCGGGRVQVHETAQLRRGVAHPVTVRVRASSTVTSHGGSLYVARFDREAPARMYRYDIEGDGLPVATDDAYVVPPRTQGVAFADTGDVYFSRSWGRTAPSVLTRVPADAFAADGGWTPCNGHDRALPAMAEGSVIVDGRLHQLYESGALAYRRHRRAHLTMTVVVGRLHPRDRLTVHDLEDLVPESPAGETRAAPGEPPP